jgi:hypothetical protein
MIGVHVTAEFTRDAAATAMIFGFFASSWFGWAQEQPPPSWRRTLVLGSIVSLLIVIAGGVLTWQHWSDGTAFNPNTSRTFGIIVGIEFAVAGLGAAVFARWRKADLIAPWIALVVGIHLFPLASLLRYPLLYVVATLVTIFALAAVPLARLLSIRVSAITGLATGTVLCAAALFSLLTVVS